MKLETAQTLAKGDKVIVKTFSSVKRKERKCIGTINNFSDDKRCAHVSFFLKSDEVMCDNWFHISQLSRVKPSVAKFIHIRKNVARIVNEVHDPVFARIADVFKGAQAGEDFAVYKLYKPKKSSAIKRMTRKAMNEMYTVLLSRGWTDEQLIKEGYMHSND